MGHYNECYEAESALEYSQYYNVQIREINDLCPLKLYWRYSGNNIYIGKGKSGLQLSLDVSKDPWSLKAELLESKTLEKYCLYNYKEFIFRDFYEYAVSEWMENPNILMQILFNKD